jgi:HlyD family secretion protein
MTRGSDVLRLLIALPAPLLLGATKLPPAITGEVQAVHGQPIYTPASRGPVVLRYYVPDGDEVAAGAPVLRIDPGEAASRLRTLESDIAKAEATAEKDIAELEVKAIDAELALVDAEAKFATARIDATLPRELISALDFDRYQGEHERAQHELTLKKQELATAREEVARRRRDAQLELKRKKLEEQFYRTKLKAAEIRAERSGVVLHATDFFGKRFDEGSTSFSGVMVGEIVSPGAASVQAYALETDRSYFSPGGSVKVEFDALPGVSISGQIASISGAPAQRREWGEGRYYTIDIVLPEAANSLPLMPGMSAKVRAIPLQARIEKIAP